MESAKRAISALQGPRHLDLRIHIVLLENIVQLEVHQHQIAQQVLTALKILLQVVKIVPKTTTA